MRRLHLTAAVANAALVLPLFPTTASAVIHADNTFDRAGHQLTLAIDDDDSPPPCQIHSSHGIRDRDGCATNSISWDTLDRLRTALQVMQTSWFEVWVGNWPAAIDWTRAVVDTHLIATLGTFSRALDVSRRSQHDAAPLDEREIENEINAYFSQNVAYYFGENAFRIRNEAYDDMLWVVLGWLESVKFIHSHSQIHYPRSYPGEPAARWHGSQFVEAFAHRARVFYEIAARGWDTQLCDGGMVWSPTVGPYKNAITNELFISASVGMYLYFPGDNNSSPFIAEDLHTANAAKPYSKVHLHNAIDGYNWLNQSGMTNGMGLYTDGFHISNWKKNGTKCDIRNDMVYTYNQGALLSGLRGLWEATDDLVYLEDGHQLVKNVIRATAWPEDVPDKVGCCNWAGLGRGGVLEEYCDATGRCSQDAQTFKSIFFHHLTLFCEKLPLRPVTPGKTYAAGEDLAYWHRQNCKQYAPWVEHNAQAALETRNGNGRFGMWWGAREDAVVATPLPQAANDYRNNVTAVFDHGWAPEGGFAWSAVVHQQAHLKGSYEVRVDNPTPVPAKDGEEGAKGDLNDRGRGRTVETQAGGVAVLRCLWELSNI